MITRLPWLTFVLLLIVATNAAGAVDRPRPPHHQINIRLDPDAGRLDVVDRMKVSGPAILDLQLAPWLRISRLTVDGRPLAVDTLELPRVAAAVGETRDVVVAYGGTLPAERRSADDGPLIGAEGTYLPAGSGWLPATAGGRVTYTLSVTVPPGSRAVATGDLVTEEDNGKHYRATFVADRPSEPPSVFAGPYVVREVRLERIRLRTYFHPELVDLADAYLDRSAGYLEWFEKRIGPYPFDDFFVISSPLPVGLGFRNLTYVGRRVLPLPFMRGRSLAHEILHNWWGNGVYVDYGTGNWSEGLTTYMADYALAAQRGREAALNMRLTWLRDFTALPSERDFPLAAFTARHHQASQVVGYDKAAFVFLMLRDAIGEAAFDAGIRLFWQRNLFATAGWSDLRRAFEDTSARDLSRFFAEWLRRSGAPRLELVAARPEIGNGGHRVSVTLGQDVPTYDLKVPVVVETSDGVTRADVDLTGARTPVAIEVGGPPLAVSVDPDYRVFRRLAAEEAPPILREITIAPAALVVIATDGGDTDAAARSLATKLLDRAPRFVAADAARADAAPLLVIGTRPAVGRVIDEVGLGAVPEIVAGHGTARVWAGRQANRRPFAVIAADDGDALAALDRPLPHYSRMSYLAFDGGKAVVKGVWPAGKSPLHRDLAKPSGSEQSATPG
jgi:hypothetical protein